MPIYSQLIEADVPEVLARRLVRHVAENLEPDQFDRARVDPRGALPTAVEQCIPVAPPIRAVAGHSAGRGPGRADRRRQDDDRRQARRQFQAGPRRARRAGHGGYLPDRGGRAAQDLCRDHRPAAGRGQRSRRNAPGPRRAGRGRPVFIDTAGRSPRDEVKIRELAEFLLQARPDEVHLVLSAVAGQRSLRSAVERFAIVQVDRLILTKLDEADSLGGVLAVLGLSSRPVSYLTTGQAVPDDIEPADRKRLARLILRQEDLV